jgi:hypothetical protein
MYASIFTARKSTHYKFELVVHSQPSINGFSVEQSYLFHSKKQAKVFAVDMGLKAWNY